METGDRTDVRTGAAGRDPPHEGARVTPTLAEQSEDWTEPGAHPVVPGVHRVPLPIPSTGLHAVNAYIIDGPEGPVLVDPGWAMPDTDKALTSALKTLGHAPDDIAQILVTHAHWDHFSHALALRERLGIRV